jgi:hypothetical protein
MVVTLAGALGYGWIVAPAQSAIRAQEEHAHQLYALATRDERLLEDAPSLQRARARVDRDLALLHATRTTRSGVATLVLIADQTRLHRVAVVGVEPEAPISPSGSEPTQRDDSIVSLRGAYADVLSAIADLPQHDVVLSVRSIELQAARGSLVDARVHMSVYTSLHALLEDRDDVATAHR